MTGIGLALAPLCPQDHFSTEIASSGPRMNNPINLVVAVAIGAVAVVLLLGLYNMVSGGSANRSQQLMRWRVFLQFIAILIIMGVIWWRAV